MFCHLFCLVFIISDANDSATFHFIGDAIA